MVRVPLKKYLKENPEKVLVSDGGQGLELERRGLDIKHRLWSTRPFLSKSFWSDPSSNDIRIVKGMFEDFVNAGAEILMTTTYQTSFKAVSESTELKSLREYNELLDKIVGFTRACIGDNRYLIGSIGSYGALVGGEYSGDYGDSPETVDFYSYFKPQLDNFLNNDEIDIVGFETIANFTELKSLLSWDEKKVSKPFYISLSVHDNGNLRDGTPMHLITDYIKSLATAINPNLTFLGVNCVNYNKATEIIDSIHNGLPTMPLSVFPNSGEVFNVEKGIWTANPEAAASWEAVVKRFISSGVRIVGGCCRTRPHDIEQISKAVKKLSN
ncbi:hypothetical protein KAFR_0L00150 [Kazachstania africana CBS 2517]|uniref:homocysteine S-methyltransferase n=1 Tax=Kazachstania africana (strain ATCC 22294 / BCRC 22015 / CBS 2517 / CECT 1963 / NBRC 1671 / NRRL Y-8276) TaxID=1071382 RepID=H2B1X2_KAZAF|nr:hypothetical protein KAFR_0L00150 [Kazachstania africana CBS 2517]CCF60622.1 hypothetical protein KAFR_0L00150 [Kazachstania africana CBS 2517]